MGGSSNEDVLAVEIMKYMGRSYVDYLDTPYTVIQAILIRMNLENKQK